MLGTGPIQKNKWLRQTNPYHLRLHANIFTAWYFVASFFHLEVNCAISSSADKHCCQIESAEGHIAYIARYWKATNDRAREMGFNLLDGKDDGEYSGVGSVEIYQIFVLQDDFYSRIMSFDRDTVLLQLILIVW